MESVESKPLPNCFVVLQKDKKIDAMEIFVTNTENFEAPRTEPKNKLNESKESFSDEDVPSDFFDDFSNQDFMAGLDVVDAWDGDELNAVPEDKPVPVVISPKKTSTSADRIKHQSEFLSKYRIPRRSREKQVKSKGISPKSAERIRKEDEKSSDQRRDPEKTKRDIQRDKDKCAKDKEAKIICEKLKVVETGLVPPGTEMEVDLKQFETDKVEPKVEKEELPRSYEFPRNLHPNTAGKVPKSVEKNHPVKRSRENAFAKAKSREIVNTRGRSRDKVPKGSREFVPPKKSHERIYSKGRSREKILPVGRSRPFHHRSRSPVRDKHVYERRKYEEKRPYRGRDATATYLRRSSRDPSLELSSSPVSEREMWLRRKRHDRRSFERSLSPLSDFSDLGRGRDILKDLENKLQEEKERFAEKRSLKELESKLNDSHSESPPQRSHLHPTHSQSNYQNVSIPTPVPPVHSAPPPGVQPPEFYHVPTQYDQQFFVGPTSHFTNPYEVPMGPMYNMYMPQPMFHPQMTGPYMNVPEQMHHAPVPVPAPMSVNPPPYIRSNNVDLLKNAGEQQKEKENGKETANKLFEDKKISLTDFLSITAKSSDPTKPPNIHSKLKVITRCQEAIKELSSDSKLNGRFFCLRTAREAEKLQDSKVQSPMRRVPVIRFPFTTPSKGGDEKQPFNSMINKLLASLGLVKEIQLPPPVTPPAQSPKPNPITPFPLQAAIPSKPKAVPVKKYDPILGAKFQMKMVQTDPVKCLICDVRSVRKFTDKAVQCDDLLTTSAETQVSEEDWSPPVLKSSMKNQSLAHLTPAQLLAQTDMTPRSSRMVSPPPAPFISTSSRNDARFNSPGKNKGANPENRVWENSRFANNQFQSRQQSNDGFYLERPSLLPNPPSAGSNNRFFENRTGFQEGNFPSNNRPFGNNNSNFFRGAQNNFSAGPKFEPPNALSGSANFSQNNASFNSFGKNANQQRSQFFKPDYTSRGNFDPPNPPVGGRRF